jgi:hypothetical protein
MDSPDYHKPPVHDESIGQKLLRETELLASVGQGFGEAAKEAFRPEHLPETVGKVATSAVLGVVIGRYAVASGFRGALSRSAAVGAGLSFLGDIVGNGAKLSDAVKDTWHSAAHREADLSVARETIGKFAFDTALMTAGGLAVSHAGSLLFSAKAPPEFVNRIHWHELDVPPTVVPELGALHSRLVSSRNLSENLQLPVANVAHPFSSHADFSPEA